MERLVNGKDSSLMLVTLSDSPLKILKAVFPPARLTSGLGTWMRLKKKRYLVFV